MSIEQVKDQLPDYAKDIKLNLSSLLSDETLNDQQKYGTFLVSALASRNEAMIKATLAEAESQLPGETVIAAKKAAAIMAMNNVYYRFTHLVGVEDYKSMPAKLRMNALANPGVDKTDFELWSLAASAINGCGMCMSAHESVVRKGGLTTDQVQTATRIASVVHAASVVLDNEAAF